MLVSLSGVCGLSVLVLLRRGQRRGTRLSAVGAVGSMIWAWGVAQHPYLLPQTLTIEDGASPGVVLTSLLVVFAIAVLLVLPSLVLLFTLAQRNIVEESAAPRAHHGPN